MTHILYTVIIDIDTTHIAKVENNFGINELREDANALKAFIEMMSEENKAWNAVLAGKKAAVVFDGDTLDMIRINYESMFFIM